MRTDSRKVQFTFSYNLHRFYCLKTLGRIRTNARSNRQRRFREKQGRDIFNYWNFPKRRKNTGTFTKMFAVDLSPIVFESPSVATRISFRADFIAPENPCQYVRNRLKPTRFAYKTERRRVIRERRRYDGSWSRILRVLFFSSSSRLSPKVTSISRTESAFKRDVIRNGGGAHNGRFRVGTCANSQCRRRVIPRSPTVCGSDQTLLRGMPNSNRKRRFIFFFFGNTGNVVCRTRRIRAVV